MNRKPNLFIVGPPKTGSTALYEFLGKHPNIFMPDMKELAYFCTDLHKESDKFHEDKKRFPIRTKKDYMKKFRDWKSQKYGCDCTTNYFLSDIAAKKIHEFNPEAKIIIVIREPVDYISSVHNQTLQNDAEDQIELNKALDLENERKKDWSKISKRTAIPRNVFYSEFPYFSKKIKEYQKLFGEKNVKIVLFDEFKRDNKKIYLDIINFLNIEKNHMPRFKSINSRYTIKYKIIRDIGYSPIIWKIPKLLFPKKFYVKVKAKFNDFLRIPAKKPKIDTKLELKLKKKYFEEVNNLSKLLQKDLINQWNYNKINGKQE